MIVVAVLVLPVLSLLLLVMSRVEDWLNTGSRVPRHAHARRHLKLTFRGASDSRGRSAAGPSPQRTRAA
ncbi:MULTISPECIES: hypothetical protein [Streptomyces]|uniref:hypothetical protein n=1 Tax=Streptomyces TaxID=1883 RepID=UPI0029317935|nr:hypothetical protein [Streptomyces sp. NEAU-HV9]